MTAGPVFTEEMWRLACCALQDAFSATLEPVKVNCLFADRQNVITAVIDSVTFGRLLPWQKHKDYVVAFVILSIHSQ